MKNNRENSCFNMKNNREEKLNIKNNIEEKREYYRQQFQSLNLNLKFRRKGV